MARIGFVTTDKILQHACSDQNSYFTSDDQLVVNVLSARGHLVEPILWKGFEQFHEYDLFVLRSPWDYTEHASDFFNWLKKA